MTLEEAKIALEKIYKVSEEKFTNVFTPFDITKQMVNALNYDGNGKLLVLVNLEFLIILKHNNIDLSNVHYSSGCKYKIQAAINLGININNIHNLEYNNKEIKVTNDMALKFDYMVGNPPYNNGIHLQFLDTLLNKLTKNGQLIFIHPSEWVIQKKETFKNKKYKEIHKRLEQGNIHIKFINNPWLHSGGAALFVPLTITHFINNNENIINFEDSRTIGYGGMKLIPRSIKKLNSINQITIFGDCENSYTFINKIIDYSTKNNIKSELLKKNGDFYVNIARICGNGKTTIKYFDNIERTIFNMFSILNTTILEVTNSPHISKGQNGKDNGNEKLWVSFKTYDEAYNFLNFIKKSVIFRVYLSIMKIDQSCSSFIQYIPNLDWNTEWTDEKLIDLFNLTKDEVDEVYKIIDLITIK